MDEKTCQRVNPLKIHDIMNEEINKSFHDFKYDPALKENKIEQVTSRIINRLTELPYQNFKYISNSILFVKGEQEFETFSLNMWDEANDGMTCVDYTNGEIRFVMTVWALCCE